MDLSGDVTKTKIPRKLKKNHHLQNILNNIQISDEEKLEFILQSDIINSKEGILQLAEELICPRTFFAHINPSIINIIYSLIQCQNPSNSLNLLKATILQVTLISSTDKFIDINKLLILRRMVEAGLFSPNEIESIAEIIQYMNMSADKRCYLILAIAPELLMINIEKLNDILRLVRTSKDLSANLKSFLKRMKSELSINSFELLKNILICGTEPGTVGHAVLCDDVQFISKYIEENKKALKEKFFISPLEFWNSPKWSLTALCILHSSSQCLDLLLSKGAVLDLGMALWCQPEMLTQIFALSEIAEANKTEGKLINSDEIFANSLLYINDATFQILVNQMRPSSEGLGKALILASRSGYLTGFFYLLEIGADINYRSKVTGETPLIAAVVGEHYALVNFLITNKSVEVNSSDMKGMTALHHAVNRRSTQMVELLLKCDHLDVNARNGDGITPAMICAQNNDIYNLRILAKRKDMNINLKANGRFALLMASEIGSVEMIDEILKIENVDVNARGPDDTTCLFVAALLGHISCVKKLLDIKDLNPNLLTKSGQSALTISLYKRDEKLIKMLLESPKIDIEQRDKDSNTPIISATGYKYADGVRFLLSKGANPNVRGWSGNTALTTAATLGLPEIAHLLISNNANVNCRNNNGETPLIVAARSGQPDMVKLMFNTRDVIKDAVGKDNLNALGSAARANKADCVQQLLELGVDPNFALEGTPTPLCDAITRKNYEAFTTLIRSPQTDINKPSPPDNMSPVVIACYDGSPQMVVDLIMDKRMRPDTKPGCHTPWLYNAATNRPDVIAVLRNLNMLE